MREAPGFELSLDLSQNLLLRVQSVQQLAELLLPRADLDRVLLQNLLSIVHGVLSGEGEG